MTGPEHVLTVRGLPSPCWQLRNAAGGLVDDDGMGWHFEDEAEAFAELVHLSLMRYAGRRGDDETPRLMQAVAELRPCLVVVCRVCAEQMEDDESPRGWDHFTSREQAIDLVPAWGWSLDAHGEAHCPEHPPTGAERRDLSAPVPGQLDLLRSPA